MKKSVVILLFLLLTVNLVAEPLFMPGTDEVDELISLYSGAGRVFPSYSFPISRRKLIDLTDNLLDMKLPVSVKARTEILLSELSVGEDNSVAELDWHAGYEHYLRTKDIEFDIKHDYLEELPLASFGVAYTNYDYGGAYLEMQLKREYSQLPDNNLFISKPGNPVSLENQIVSKSYVYFENDFLMLAVGRFPSHFGDPRFTTFMASQELPYLDQIKMDISIENFKLEYYVASLENREADDDFDLTETDFAYGENAIYTMMHRLVYSLDKFRLSHSEQAVVCRANNQLYIGDFIPLSIWHNTWLSNINISMYTDLNWAILPGLELYFQWAFEDINASEVFGVIDSALPTIDAKSIGLCYSGVIVDYPLTVKAEVGNTHYLWGSFDAANPLQEAVYRIKLDYGNKLIPLNSPYGPGTVWGKLDSEIKTDFGLSGGIYLDYLNKNLYADIITTAYERDDETVNAAPHSNRAEVGIKAKYRLFDRLEFFVEPAFLYLNETDSAGKITSDTTWVECTLGGKVYGHEIF